MIVVGSIKGGSGKSIIATNLSILPAKKGREVLLVDADDPETATDFTQLRNEKLDGYGWVYQHQVGRLSAALCPPLTPTEHVVSPNSVARYPLRS
jgi:cellulose biosynthesis protein BcsQ